MVTLTEKEIESLVSHNNLQEGYIEALKHEVKKMQFKNKFWFYTWIITITAFLISTILCFD